VVFIRYNITFIMGSEGNLYRTPHIAPIGVVAKPFSSKRYFCHERKGLCKIGERKRSRKLMWFFFPAHFFIFDGANPVPLCQVFVPISILILI
jgi:hypothetical protein